MALASPRTSAHIIPFPGAAAAPVVNPKRRLRYSTVDRNVVNIKKLRVDRSWRLQQEREAQAEYLQQCEVVEHLRTSLYMSEVRQMLIAQRMGRMGQEVRHV